LEQSSVSIYQISDQFGCEVLFRKFEECRGGHLGPLDNSKLDEAWKNARRLAGADPGESREGPEVEGSARSTQDTKDSPLGAWDECFHRLPVVHEGRITG